jgi:transcriptional regulator with XRE-family HTH domain
MEAGTIIRAARQRSSLSLRDLGREAGTSHSTIAAYEAGRKQPSVDTFVRLLRAAGFELDQGLVPAVGGVDPAARGRELEAVLELAAQFPARHTPHLEAPIFGRSPIDPTDR